jgi:hypothetical protein
MLGLSSAGSIPQNLQGFARIRGLQTERRVERRVGDA